MSSRWVRRAGAGALLFVALEVLLRLAGAGPEPLRVALLVAMCVGVLGLVLDALSDPAPAWDLEPERPSVREGSDARLGLYVGLIEAHLAARTDDAALRERLRTLTDQVLTQRHGVRRDDPRAADLLGPELVAVLTGPVRRLSPADIDRCLTRIEEL
jgi:hypothetical protein